MRKKVILLSAVFFFTIIWLHAEPQKSPDGADAVPDLYAPNLAGPGGFTTTTGGAPASAHNPAQGAGSHRMILDLGYLAIPSFTSKQDGYMQSLELGALFPTRYGVFGGSMRFIGGFGGELQFHNFPIEPTFSGNFFAAKELYPGMSVGAGLNFGVGAEWTLSGDLGFRYNIGKLGPLENFTWAVVLRSLGKSYFPTWLTATGGVSFDFFHIEGSNGKPDPLLMSAAADLSIPSLFYPPYINMIIKTGIKITVAELITFSFSWPGGSGLNMRELAQKPAVFQPYPSIGVGVNFILPTGGRRIAGDRLPSDGDLKIDTAFKPLYAGVTAIGAGVSWYVGISDRKPPVIAIDYPQVSYFSPNHDGVKDYLEFPVSITDDNYVVSWIMEISDEDGNVIRTFENKEQRLGSFDVRDIFNRLKAEKKQIETPSSLRWDGIRNSGEMSGDGRYFFTITAVDNSGNTSVSPAYETILKNTPPQITIEPMTDAHKIFNPRGENRTVTFVPTGSEEEAWESGIWNASGEKIRTFEVESGPPSARVWDGRDDLRDIAPDGVYVYRIGATDRAGNSASAQMNNIILDAREAGAFLTSSVSAIAPKPGEDTALVDFAIRLLLQDGIDNWKLELKTEDSSLITFSGTGEVPAVQSWNGLDAQGLIREGVYTPQLTVTYTKGDVVSATATTVTVDASGPELSLSVLPDYFSPDNDGEEDELFIYPLINDASPIANWSIEIREPEAPYIVFRLFEGRGNPSERLIWDGKSDWGELVQSATDYSYTFTAQDILGNISITEGRIGVDVLLISDGDQLRIQVPSIIFRPNFADFEGLSADIVENNNRILRRIAQILNRFRDYKVQVEGHANPTQPAGPARDSEEAELKRLSEERARVVADILARNGVARNRLIYYGVGGSNPIAAFEDYDNWWKNRRVEFILVK
jgi:outer membrane protein OmpA-like peptidoglycan-associated protein/flagellar hook assembly protein FlgD